MAFLHPGTSVVIVERSQVASSIRTIGKTSLHEGKQIIDILLYKFFMSSL